MNEVITKKYVELLVPTQRCSECIEGSVGNARFDAPLRGLECKRPGRRSYAKRRDEMFHTYLIHNL